MTKQAITDEQVIDLIAQGKGFRAISSDYTIGRSRFERLQTQAAKRGKNPGYEINRPVPDGWKLKGVSDMRTNPEGKPIWYKFDEDKDRQAEIAEELVRSMMRDIKPRKTPKLSTHPNEDLLVSYPVVDAHIGMLAWGKEVGEDWDLDIASERMIKAFQYLVANSPAASQCIIENLGDYFHADNMEGVTSRSKNSLDMDSRFGKMIDIGVDVIVAMIDEALKRHATVYVANLRGNHDETASIVMNSCLSKMYEGNERVIIDPSPSVFKYHRFGKVFIGMHHGHTTKMADLPGVMAVDRAKDWGETVYRYWHTGHIHHKSFKGKESSGCMPESFRTLIPNDSFSHSLGVRSMSEAVAIVYHREFGEINRQPVNAAMIEAMG